MVNLTNDGWFHWWGPQQHLQAAVFRSIENRVPTARAVNTGVSGFIDSSGRTDGIVAFATEGTSVRQVMIDRRVTFYTRFGDVFAIAVLLVFAAMVAAALIRRTKCRPAA
jgi:apolipoprotein N-acyltransferase